MTPDEQFMLEYAREAEEACQRSEAILEDALNRLFENERHADTDGLIAPSLTGIRMALMHAVLKIHFIMQASGLTEDMPEEADRNLFGESAKVAYQHFAALHGGFDNVKRYAKKRRIQGSK